MTNYSLGGANRGLAHITLGSDGNIWFAENIGNGLGRVHVGRKSETSIFEPLA